MSRTDLPSVTLLLQEIQSVTSSMRRNQRWASTTSSSSPLPPAFHPRNAKRSRAAFGARGSRLSIDTSDDGDLMTGFVLLRRNLNGVKDITTLPPLTLVQPFIELIRSPVTSGPVTSLALVALHSIILNILPLYLAPVAFIVTPSTPLQIALARVTSALSQCRFPSSSPQQDELVLHRLLRMVDALLVKFPMPNSSSTGMMTDQMADESVCELLEVGLGMLARARLGEGLRNAAEICVQAVVRACFERLKSLSKKDVDALLQSVRAGGGETVVHVDAVTSSGKESLCPNGVQEEKDDLTDAHTHVKPVPDATEPQSKSSIESVENVEPPPFTPYGLPTILELLRVLIALLNPSDQAHTDTMRLSALAIMNSALEVGGATLGEWTELREGVRDEGCRYLFQLTRSDSPALLARSLRTTSTLFATLLPHLKLQLELFLSYLIDRLTPPIPNPIPPHLMQSSRPGTPSVDGHADADSGTPADTGPSTPKPMSLLPPVPNETKELMLETLGHIGQRPSFMVDCWTNFDCSTDSEDMFERIVAFLTRGVYPAGPPKADGSSNLFDGLDNAQLLSLESLLTFVQSMAERLEEGDQPWPTDAVSTETLMSRKDRKGVLLIGASMFNAKPKQGIAMLEKEGLITSDTGSGTEEEKRYRGIAKFLRSSSRLDKRGLGDYISRPDQVGLLKAFIGLFDFKGKSIADAMREMLESFRLPGEASPIARITETFAEHFFSFAPPEIASQDAVYVLAYSVIMLNTDLHNPQNRKRMTIDDYRRNLRGVNDGKDFDPEYLAAIHESLKKKEIILPEEHVGQPGFDFAWRGLMQRSRTAGPMVICNTSIFDRHMFGLTWRPLVAAIAYAFTMSAQDEHVIQRSITGFRQCASLAGHFRLPEVIETIVQSLSPATGLSDDSEDGYEMANYPVVEKDNQSVTVSPLSIKFGQSYRSQLAAVVVFGIANGNGNAIRLGWTQIFEIFQTLFLHSLLPARMLQMEDFLAGTTTIPMRSANPTVTPVRHEGGGLLSTLSSYLLSPYGASNDAITVESSEEDVENTLVAVDCLNSCKIEELYGEILSLELDALVPAIKAIRTLAEARTTQRLRHRRRSSVESPTFEREGQLAYDPACVFHLEMMVSLATRGRAHIAETWPIIFEYIASLLGSAQSYSVLLIERAVVGLLRLCLIVSETPTLRDQLYIALDVLRSLPSTVLNAVSEQLMAGVAKIIDKDTGVIRSQTEWGLIIALFRATVAHPEASKVTLGIVQKMTASAAVKEDESEGTSHPGVSVDNYGAVVALLDEFATAAGAAVLGRQQRRGNEQPTLGPTVEKGLAALDSLYDLRNVVPYLIHTCLSEGSLSEQETWNTFWLPLLSVLSKQCINANSPIRQRAITYLQRLLLSPTIAPQDPTKANSTIPVFDRVLFPILDELLKSADPNFGETKLRAANLLCKVFLADVGRFSETQDGDMVVVLFGRVLGVMERMIRAERDGMNEAGESLKNVILVLHSSALLVPPPLMPQTPTADQQPSSSDPRSRLQQELWTKSVARIDRVLPGFLDEVIPRPEVVVAPEAESEKRKSVEGQA